MKKFSLDDLKRIFRYVAIKTVTKTDVNKDAYVVTQDQQGILEQAGYRPGVYPLVTTVPIILLGTGECVKVSYYGSQRAGSGRTPEYRMGRFLDRIKIGDDLAFVTDGLNVYLCLVSKGRPSSTDVNRAYEEALVVANENLPLRVLIKRAKQARRKPLSQQTTKTIYNRDATIVALTHRRSGYKCEMPDCNYMGFNKINGGKFIETHHITPLSVGGEDSIENVAALCPTCHRMLHYAQDQKRRKHLLKDAVMKANLRLGI
jgi:5-methylcytosine-specific restriction endonuclease McrA